TSTGSCPIKRAVRENNQYQNDPPTRPNTASYGSVTVQPAQSTRSCGFHEPTHVAPGVPQRKPQYESNQAWQSPVKDVRGNEDSDKTEGILTPIQVSEISRLLGLHKNKENQKGTSNSQSGQDKNELPLAHELFNYLRELPQIKDESYLCRPNDQQQSVVSNKQQQSAVPKTRRNLGDQTSQKGRAQQQIPTRLSAKQMNQVASQRHGLVQPMNQVGSQRHGLVQPMSQVGSQQRGMVQPNVQLCPHGRGPVTKTIMVVKKDKKSMLGRGVKKSNKGAWK
ncbi:uncharacterized protein LOC102808847, partial [Saccoglossus kowalevskii]|uniref:Uncharacterized protein LOC102808847 n=1 Tax=Saccoglossus kowalevskii TaxID=10224 RepID=A0ABM0LY98_SACKO